MMYRVYVWEKIRLKGLCRQGLFRVVRGRALAVTLHHSKTKSVIGGIQTTQPKLCFKSTPNHGRNTQKRIKGPKPMRKALSPHAASTLVAVDTQNQ